MERTKKSAAPERWVEHPAFGIGRVVGTHASSRGPSLDIEFPGAEVKRLLESFVAPASAPETYVAPNTESRIKDCKPDLLDSIEFIYGFEQATAPPIGSLLIMEHELTGITLSADHETIRDAIYDQAGVAFMETIVGSPDLLVARRKMGDDAQPHYVVQTPKTKESAVSVALYLTPPEDRLKAQRF